VEPAEQGVKRERRNPAFLCHEIALVRAPIQADKLAGNEQVQRGQMMHLWGPDTAMLLTVIAGVVAIICIRKWKSKK
jgi:hypothetical protein